MAESRVKLPSEAQIKRGLGTPQGDAPDTPWILHTVCAECYVKQGLLYLGCAA